MPGVIFSSGDPLKKRGRPLKGDAPMASRERNKEYRNKKSGERKRCIAVLDFETDPFDNVAKTAVYPFAACLYSDQFESVIIWEENRALFIRRVIAAIEALPDRYTIYAHNGGRFDFMFLVHELRGEVSFKGRGIMSAHVGAHELRDSFHIIPEKLAGYKKDNFDYSVLTKAKRCEHRKIIIDYMLNDCIYLFDIVKAFIGEFGLKMSIGQAAMYELRQHYTVKKLSENWDEYLRGYFYGGRVECLTGRSILSGDYKLYDVNSMYPFVMANCLHPIGDFFDYDMRAGKPTEDTVFIDLDCTNRGALIGRTLEGETTAGIKRGRFMTTIHEYNMALKYNLISDIEINFCVDCKEQTNFSKFVEPLYQRRLLTKKILGDYRRAGDQSSQAFLDVKKDDIFLKLLLNNAYGKFAQNPRRFKEHYITDVDEKPPIQWLASLWELPVDERDAHLLPEFESDNYWIWSKPSPGRRYNNVGTAASITGAARAVLLEALQLAVDPVYCDTDSIICRELPGLELDPEKLGAWDLEDEFSKVIINGKKLYSCWYKKPKLGPGGQIIEYKIRSKGTSGLKWSDMEDLFNGGSVSMPNFGPTLTRYNDQYYLTRKITATAAITKGNENADRLPSS